MVASIQGISQLSQAFKGLSFDMQKKLAPRMVASAGGIIRKEAKVIAQSQGLRKTGALINNIAVKREKNTGAGHVEYHVGVRHGKALGNGKKVIKYLARTKTGRIVTRRKDDPFYWSFLEFGTKHIRPHRFLSKAFANKQRQALAAMETTLQKAIAKGAK
jgi:HK97 gp10 family phage protein